LILGLFTVLSSASLRVGAGPRRRHRRARRAVVLAWLSSRWVGWLQVGAALLIVLVGLLLAANAWRTVASLR